MIELSINLMRENNESENLKGIKDTKIKKDNEKN